MTDYSISFSAQGSLNHGKIPRGHFAVTDDQQRTAEREPGLHAMLANVTQESASDVDRIGTFTEFYRNAAHH
ncbi:hypothetical protein D3C87_1723050 [compost metagenome]